MSKRKKNAGHGYGMDFHGAFSSKADAKKKERKVHGFIRPTTIKGERRYVVMSERKNPRPRRKKAAGSPRFVSFDKETGMYRAAQTTLPLGKGELLTGFGPTRRAALHDLKKKMQAHNPMDLVVMGANPAHPNPPREVVVHPGETITLKVNPSAEAIREEFTGREYEYSFISDEPHMKAGDYAKLGDLMGITYKPVSGGGVEAIGWYEGAETMPLHEAAKSLRRLTDAPVLVSAENRRQLYFVAGNQDVSPLGLEELGEARTIVYRERKHFDDFTLINYQHEFGEENGKRPTLYYDRGKNRLLLEGGDYEVRPEGIVN